MIVLVDYASPSVFAANRDINDLVFATNSRRPVRFHGTVVKHGFPLRIALRALGETIWSDDTWLAASDILDPVITVHPDRIFFEAFSQDQSTYACLIVDPEVFEADGNIQTGTTNIDFSAWLWGALGEMRTSRKTTFKVGLDGLEVATTGAGGRFEKKVELPDSWVRGFLQVQAAMAMPGTRLTVKPIDLLSAIRFLRYTKAKVSPRAIRYHFEPNQDAKLILEPWEQEITLEGAEHHYAQTKSIRVWGRRRLKQIEGLLPFAESVDIYLKGRALPSFYSVKLPGMTFLLGVTGWSGAAFTDSGSFDLLQTVAAADDQHLAPALQILQQDFHISASDLATRLQIDSKSAAALLVRLCRQGRCMFDVETRRYRHRELFETAADEATLFPPDIRREKATAFQTQGAVKITSCVPEETKKRIRLKSPDGPQHREVTYRDWRIFGNVDICSDVEVVVNDSGRIIFGRCCCDFFQQNLMNIGPCEHILALFQASDALRTDQASSTTADERNALRASPNRWEVDSGYAMDENDETT
ncbi:MAG: hypothetical protein KDA87_17740 [Planctomycetales bacterium]|nr:hypothetical protein [Planctomycetales bacterium]